jgi:purine-binding chemotaxis protein CheW
VFYAVEVARIREIVNPLPIVDLPRDRDFVLGVADYREEVVAVVDLRGLFGLPRQLPTRRTKWVILESSSRLVAVVVDAVLDVFSSAEHRQRAVPVLDERHRERGTTSACSHKHGLVFLLDADRLAEPGLQIDAPEVFMLQSEVS